MACWHLGLNSKFAFEKIGKRKKTEDRRKKRRRGEKGN
jgi:hypothetical protein